MANDKDFKVKNGLTVDSDTLVVDAANSRVGIGTSSPASNLDVVGTIQDSQGNVRALEITTVDSTSYTVASGSSGKYFGLGSGSSVVTINNSNFAVGDIITIYNRLQNDTATINFSGFTLAHIAGSPVNHSSVTLAASGICKLIYDRSGHIIIDGNVKADAIDIEYLIVGGGGAGRGGGGGAGGLLAGTTQYSAPTSFTVTVGAGGQGANGGNSSALGLTAIGGGVGGEANTDNAGSGGSGGGGGHDLPTATIGLGTSGQGNQGGRSNRNSYGAGGGGGGAGGAGADATTESTNVGRGGNGGVGVQNSITGSAVFYAGGGGGGVNTNTTDATGGGSGGAGGGGDGGLSHLSGGSNGTDGLGGGGGGGDYETDHLGGDGGSGVVILRYPSSTTLSIPAGLTYTNDDRTVAGFTITKFSGGTGTVGVNW